MFKLNLAIVFAVIIQTATALAQSSSNDVPVYIGSGKPIASGQSFTTITLNPDGTGTAKTVAFNKRGDLSDLFSDQLANSVGSLERIPTADAITSPVYSLTTSSSKKGVRASLCKNDEDLKDVRVKGSKCIISYNAVSNGIYPYSCAANFTYKGCKKYVAQWTDDKGQHYHNLSGQTTDANGNPGANQ